MGKIVSKFGGSSLSDAKQYQKVRDIIEKDPRRVIIVPSAPGRRFDTDDKITDLLYQTYRLYQEGKDFRPVYAKVENRFDDITRELGLSLDIHSYLDVIIRDLENGANEDYCASRGEYLNGIILADYLGFLFVDPKDSIFFHADGVFDSERTQAALGESLKKAPAAIVPGFYGSKPNGCIHTFSRGGSDISGAIVARAASADLYENWTDVSGLMMADPRVVENVKPIAHITYPELRELSYMGATVMHEESVFPVHRAGIPTNIRNTNDPDLRGTMITLEGTDSNNPYVITGIAGKKGFSVVSIEKAMMNSEKGFGRRVLQAVEEAGLSFEHLPTGIDTICVVLSTEELEPVRERLIARIMEATSPDTVTVHDQMSLIATVGRGMVHNPGTAARLFTALSREKVNVRMIDQGSSELSILVGVDHKDFEPSIRAIYEEFVQ